MLGTVGMVGVAVVAGAARGSIRRDRLPAPLARAVDKVVAASPWELGGSGSGGGRGKKGMTRVRQDDHMLQGGGEGALDDDDDGKSGLDAFVDSGAMEADLEADGAEDDVGLDVDAFDDGFDRLATQPIIKPHRAAAAAAEGASGGSRTGRDEDQRHGAEPDRMSARRPSPEESDDDGGMPTPAIARATRPGSMEDFHEQLRFKEYDM